MRVRPYRLPSRTIFSSRLLSLSAGFVCALALSNAALPTAFGQAPSAAAGVQKTPQSAAPPPSQTASVAPLTAALGKGAREGIKVNGYWKIDVRNPDGTLDKHVEFENSLAANASVVLANLLSGSGFSQGVSIYAGLPVPSTTFSPIAGFGLGGGPCGTACLLIAPSNPLYNDCVYAATQSSTGYQSSTCNTTLSQGGGAVGVISLNGSFVATSANSVSVVGTLITRCISSPAACVIPSPVGSAPIQKKLYDNTVDYEFLTGYSLPTALSVTPGQAVSISVAISFQ